MTATICAHCGKHFPLFIPVDGDPGHQFIWTDDGSAVGS